MFWHHSQSGPAHVTSEFRVSVAIQLLATLNAPTALPADPGHKLVRMDEPPLKRFKVSISSFHNISELRPLFSMPRTTSRSIISRLILGESVNRDGRRRNMQKMLSRQ